MENKYNYKALSKQELEKKFIQMKNNIPARGFTQKM